MKGLLIHTTLFGEEDLKKICRMKILGKNNKPGGSQIPPYVNKPIIFSSYYYEGYLETYCNREGIVFETDSKEVYACPADTFELLREGNWVPGYEKFVFDSIEEMLTKYPTSNDFKTDFQEHFRSLSPLEVFPNQESRRAELRHVSDYCLRKDWQLGCNEIAFEKPLRIKNIQIFKCEEELKEGLNLV